MCFRDKGASYGADYQDEKPRIVKSARKGPKKYDSKGHRYYGTSSSTVNPAFTAGVFGGGGFVGGGGGCDGGGGKSSPAHYLRIYVDVPQVGAVVAAEATVVEVVEVVEEEVVVAEAAKQGPFLYLCYGIYCSTCYIRYNLPLLLFGTDCIDLP